MPWYLLSSTDIAFIVPFSMAVLQILRLFNVFFLLYSLYLYILMYVYINKYHRQKKLIIPQPYSLSDP
jgi:membrane protein implicated in regulation of membrane protease activity